jgi:hypothetical protein
VAAHLTRLQLMSAGSVYAPRRAAPFTFQALFVDLPLAAVLQNAPLPSRFVDRRFSHACVNCSTQRSRESTYIVEALSP